MNIHTATHQQIIDSGVKQGDITLSYIRKHYDVAEERKEGGVEVLTRIGKDFEDLLEFTEGSAKITVVQLVKKLEALQTEYPGDVVLVAGYSSYNGGDYEFQRTETRDERIAEAELRLQKEAKAIIKKALDKDKEYKQYLKLKEKYEDS